ncbi:MAG TPA: IclR family transcriptional regulator [Trebonia sp.]|nr:IclR family transcriptional regulator [Trebonia sp.]
MRTGRGSLESTADGAADGAPRGDQVKALRHGLEILRMISDDQPVVGVSEMARKIGVHRSSASRLAATLHAMGFLSRAGEVGQYRLGPELIRLGRLANHDIDLVEQAIAPLRRVVEQTGETGHIGMLDGTEAVTIAVADGWQTVRMHSHVNKRSPASCSSLGKSLLSGLPDGGVRDLFEGQPLATRTEHSITALPALLTELGQVRTQGYACDNEEVELGLRCVAAPIKDASGAVVASLGLSGPAWRLTPPVVAELAEAVRRAAAEATTALGGTPPGR